MKNIRSADFLLQKVELFSKISGLEINRSKSECLILNYEMNLCGYTEVFLGIPVVENLKILGHYHGKSERVCMYQNFYSKLSKMENVLNAWKGRNLTIFGKNLLINALSNSLFVFNAQIENPPKDFIKLTEKIHKDFLWNGVPKIAHHTIIADYSNGGLRYKDLNDFIASLNLKFLYKMHTGSKYGHSILPNYWIKNLFKIPESISILPWDFNILDCAFKVPRKSQYKGHPFYYQVLKDHQKMSEIGCRDLESILSVSIWYNRHMNTKFDLEIAKAGFNFVKDLYPCNKQIENFSRLSGYKSRKLRTILDKIPTDWKAKIESSPNLHVTVHPLQKICYKGQDSVLRNMRGDQLYNLLIENKTRLPAGLLKWREIFDLSDNEIRVALTFARTCTSLVSNHVFQYKIITQILPTQKYLARFKIVNSNICQRCNNEPDTIIHCIWSCPIVHYFVNEILMYLSTECAINSSNLPLKSDIFGCPNQGTNHILLELKKEMFYNKDLDMNQSTFCEYFLKKIGKIMVKEKNIMLEMDKFEFYDNKWTSFKNIYNYLGPDYQIV